MSYNLSPATPNGNPLNVLLFEFSHMHGDADATTYTEIYVKCQKEELDTLEVYIRFLTDYFDSMDREYGTSYLYKNGENVLEIGEEVTVPVFVKQNRSMLDVTINGRLFSLQFEYDIVYQDSYCCSAIDRVLYYDDCGNEFLFELN